MIEINDLQLASSIGVLFTLKEKHSLKTLQETYKLLEDSNMDTMMEVLSISYNKAHENKELTVEQFVDLLDKKGLGLIKITEAYQKVIEALMFSGLSPEEVESRKNAIMNLKK